MSDHDLDDGELSELGRRIWPEPADRRQAVMARARAGGQSRAGRLSRLWMAAGLGLRSRRPRGVSTGLLVALATAVVLSGGVAGSMALRSTPAGSAAAVALGAGGPGGIIAPEVGLASAQPWSATVGSGAGHLPSPCNPTTVTCPAQRPGACGAVPCPPPIPCDASACPQPTPCGLLACPTAPPPPPPTCAITVCRIPAPTPCPGATAGSTLPCPPAPAGTVTLTEADNGRTITVRAGTTIYVQLHGSTIYQWTVPLSSDHRVVTPITSALGSTGDATGSFRAATSGTAQLSAAENPHCRPQCGIPSRLWMVSVTVVTPPLATPPVG